MSPRCVAALSVGLPIISQPLRVSSCDFSPFWVIRVSAWSGISSGVWAVERRRQIFYSSIFMCGGIFFSPGFVSWCVQRLDQRKYEKVLTELWLLFSAFYCLNTLCVKLVGHMRMRDAGDGTGPKLSSLQVFFSSPLSLFLSLSLFFPWDLKCNPVRL